MTPPLRVGTRSSALAIAQTDWVTSRLSDVTGRRFRRVEIETTGDRSAEKPSGDGMFVKEIQRALLEGEIDLAVHSLKDLPTAPTPGLVIAAIPVRADPRETLVGSTVAGLADGARVGTGSPRRSAQLRALRPDLQVVPIRGNVPTRVRKAREKEVDAVMLAAAGLERLGIEADEYFSLREVLPAPGQGALAVEVRVDDPTSDIARMIDDYASRTCAESEREVLRALGGGCLLPVGVYAEITGEGLHIDARIVAADGSREARAKASGDPARADAITRLVAERLIEQGAKELM